MVLNYKYRKVAVDVFNFWMVNREKMLKPIIGLTLSLAFFLFIWAIPVNFYTKDPEQVANVLATGLIVALTGLGLGAIIHK